jgi:hypothetical protein
MLGARVKVILTGAEGIVTKRTESIDGPPQVFVDFRTDDAGKSLGHGGYDEADVEIVTAPEKAAKSEKA